MRILYVHATVVPPPLDSQADRFFLLSEQLDGDVLHPLWYTKKEEVEAEFGSGSFPEHRVGNFRYHWFLAQRGHSPWARFMGLVAYVRKGVEIFRQRRYDCIVVYSHMTTGLLACLMKLMTGARLVVEIATSPERVYITEKPKPGLREWIMRIYSDLCLHVAVLTADRAHLLYANQLIHYPLLRKARASVFHEYVPVHTIDRPVDDHMQPPYLLMVGAPWYLKGADILIEAFQQLSKDYPELQLKILGHFPDRAPLEALAAGNPKIEIMKAKLYSETLQVIRHAKILVLPSRCEGMGRVLIEAMAAGVPVVGSEVGGIPSIIEHRVTGLLFPEGDVPGLRNCLRQLLDDPALYREFARRGYDKAHRELNEKVYVERFAAMITAAVSNHE